MRNYMTLTLVNTNIYMKQRYTNQYTSKKRAQCDTQQKTIDYYTCVNTIQNFIYKTYTKQYLQTKSNIKEISNIYIYMH